jgi:ubiquinone/menaquinone biosynthesis C-methylase UbiE
VTSISFDRAADFYDATRGIPAEHVDPVMDILLAELAGRERCLEIGVGTGRIALPLHQRHVPLVGIDLSATMLGRLAANAGGRAPFPIAVADATGLPFADSSYDAVLASHVFHLIPGWRAAADEVLRVLRPAGRLIVDFGGGVDSPWRPLLLEAMRKHGIERNRPGANKPEELAAYLGDRVRMRPLPAHLIPVRRSIGNDLRDIERQIFSWTWPYPAERVRAAADDLRERAHVEGLDLDAEVDLTYSMQWWAFDLDA